ncbi:DUF1134 domain-containing protein [Hartmannibacter diazotrophicus]
MSDGAGTRHLSPASPRRHALAAWALLCAILPALVLALPSTARAQQAGSNTGYSQEELVNAGNEFFGQISAGLASVIERAVSNYGQPNGYILGQEATGAIFGGLRYGEGTLFTRNAGNLKVYWQGPTFGFDLGADGARTMMLVYNLPAVNSIYQRFGGVDGSAYLVGGFGMTVLRSGGITLVPVRSGIGGRLGINVGYLKFTPQPTWNPF